MPARERELLEVQALRHADRRFFELRCLEIPERAAPLIIAAGGDVGEIRRILEGEVRAAFGDLIAADLKRRAS